MARKDISMSPEEVEEFLTSGAKVVQVATLGPDGFPHVAPLWFVVDGGKVVFRSFTKSQKVVNLRRDPRLTVLVEEGLSYAELQGVMIKGTARLVDDAEYTLDLYVRLAGRYPILTGADPGTLSEDEVRAAFRRYADKNTAVVVEPVSVVSWDHGKLAGAY